MRAVQCRNDLAADHDRNVDRGLAADRLNETGIWKNLGNGRDIIRNERSLPNGYDIVPLGPFVRLLPVYGINVRVT